MCFDGNLFELVKRFLSAIPGEAQVPGELVYVTHSARVRVEGDCSILDEILNPVRERRVRNEKPERR